jgi:transcription elongation factor GreA
VPFELLSDEPAAPDPPVDDFELLSEDEELDPPMLPLLPLDEEDPDPPVPDDELLSLEDEPDCELLSVLPLPLLLLWANAGAAKSIAADIIPTIFFMRGSFRSRIAAKLGASTTRGNKEAGVARQVRPMPVRHGVHSETAFPWGRASPAGQTGEEPPMKVRPAKTAEELSHHSLNRCYPYKSLLSPRPTPSRRVAAPRSATGRSEDIRMPGNIPITPAGLRKLKEELKQLQTVERVKISREIETARGHGDLRENAEYHAAKEKQSHIEGRILTLNDWIARAEVVDVSRLSGDRVVFGATVVLADQETEDEKTYRIVGEIEADLKQGKIAVTSPLAQGLVGKRAGDVATIQSPRGPREFEILEVRFEDEAPAAESTGS